MVAYGANGWRCGATRTSIGHDRGEPLLDLGDPVGVGEGKRAPGGDGIERDPRIRAGTMSVNGGNWFAPDVPFGGYKQSGAGGEGGVAGLEEFLEIKVLAIPVADRS